MSLAIESARTLKGEPPRLGTDLSATVEGILERAGLGPAQSNLRSHLIIGTVRLVTLVAVDLTAIVGAREVLRVLRGGGAGHGLRVLFTGLFPAGTIPGAELAVAILVSFFFLGCYREGHRWREPVKILTAAAIGSAVAFYADVWHGPAAVVASRAFFVWLFLGPLLVAFRAVASSLAHWLARAGLKHRVLEIRGENVPDSALDLGPSYKFVASLTQTDVLMDIPSMEQRLEGDVDTILVRGEFSAERFRGLTDFALTHGCRLLCAPHSGHGAVEKRRVWVEGHPLLQLTAPGLRASHLVLKRALDLVVACLTVAVLSPVMLAIAAWIKIDSPGPILFRQRRPGIQGRTFSMLKFRSMRSDAEDMLDQDADLYERFLGNGCKLPHDEDPRITPVGRFLRRTSLDELPQLFNVIRGDMSLVGPRPLVGPELENYGGLAPTLLSVKPGMTGLWQVSGRSTIPFPERAEIDLEYVRNWSFLGDFWILALTPAAVIMRKGAH